MNINKVFLYVNIDKVFLYMNINKVPAIIIGFLELTFHSTFTQVHLKTKNVICEQCGSTFYHASNLKRHREAVHLVK